MYQSFSPVSLDISCNHSEISPKQITPLSTHVARGTSWPRIVLHLFLVHTYYIHAASLNYLVQNSVKLNRVCIRGVCKYTWVMILQLVVKKLNV